MSDQGEHSPIALHAAFNWNTYNQYLAWSRKPGNVATEGARSYWKCSETRKKCPWSLSVPLFNAKLKEIDFQDHSRFPRRQYQILVWPKFCRYVLLSGREAQATLEDVVIFATGANIPPTLGFDTIPTISFTDGGFPTANTCATTLRLPTIHTSYEDFK